MSRVTARPVDAETFRALARSSPWLWRSVRFTLAWDAGTDVRAWVRRPEGLRVETLDGELLEASTAPPGPTYGVLTAVVDGAATATGGDDTPCERPAPPQPTRDTDGLVRAPRRRHDFYDYDSPMYQSYYWVALLDPRELTDGADPEGVDPEPRPGTVIDEVVAVDHHGRPALEALVRPTDAYEPRCGCCALLPDLAAETAEWGDELPRVHPAGYVYPEACRVRVDAATGICVRLEHVGGSEPGRRHELVIEAVDEPMPDELFVSPGPRPGQRVAQVRDRLLGRFVPGVAPAAARGWSPYLE